MSVRLVRTYPSSFIIHLRRRQLRHLRFSFQTEIVLLRSCVAHTQFDRPDTNMIVLLEVVRESIMSNRVRLVRDDSVEGVVLLHNWSREYLPYVGRESPADPGNGNRTAEVGSTCDVHAPLLEGEDVAHRRFPFAQ